MDGSTGATRLAPVHRGLGVDSFSILFNHRSFQKPAVSPWILLVSPWILLVF